MRSVLAYFNKARVGTERKVGNSITFTVLWCRVAYSRLPGRVRCGFNSKRMTSDIFWREEGVSAENEGCQQCHRWILVPASPHHHDKRGVRRRANGTSGPERMLDRVVPSDSIRRVGSRDRGGENRAWVGTHNTHETTLHNNITFNWLLCLNQAASHILIRLLFCISYTLGYVRAVIACVVRRIIPACSCQNLASVITVEWQDVQRM